MTADVIRIIIEAMTATLQHTHETGPLPVYREAEHAAGTHRTKGTALILPGVVLIAVNLRLSVSATGALLDQLGGSLHLGSGVESFLTAVWPLAFAVGGISGSWLARRYTAGTVISWAIGALAIGQLVHSLHSTPALVLGSVLAGLGIALANVLLPVVVRQYFPDRVGPVTGLYAMVLSGGAAFAALSSVPVSDHVHNVDAGLAVWVIPAVIALGAWIAARPQRAAHPTNAAAAGPAAHLPLRQLTKSRLAWSMAALFGLQSMGAYVIMGWLQTILSNAGMSAGKAGVVLSVIFFIGIPLNYAVPHFGSRMRDQRPLLTGLSLASTFSQSIGYLLSATAPLGFGLLHDATGSWTVPLLIVVVATVLQGLVGLYVASPR